MIYIISLLKGWAEVTIQEILLLYSIHLNILIIVDNKVSFNELINQVSQSIPRK